MRLWHNELDVHRQIARRVSGSYVILSGQILFALPDAVKVGNTFFFSSRSRHTRCLSDWSSDVCSSDLRPRWAASSWSERSSGRWMNGWDARLPWRPPTTCYTVMAGASWRLTSDTPKLMWPPRTPGKKTSRRPPRNRPRVAGPRADPADVSRRSALRSHLRYAALLVPQTGSSVVSGHGDAGVHLRLCSRLGDRWRARLADPAARQRRLHAAVSR